MTSRGHGASAKLALACAFTVCVAQLLDRSLTLPPALSVLPARVLTGVEVAVVRSISNSNKRDKAALRDVKVGDFVISVNGACARSGKPECTPCAWPGTHHAVPCGAPCPVLAAGCWLGMLGGAQARMRWALASRRCAT